jgi:hypothetical protein
MEENSTEKREISMIDLKDKYIVYDYSTRETKSYTANNRQNQKFREVKFYKGNKAVNYLGNRSITKKYLRKNNTKSSGNIKEEKTFTFVNRTEKDLIKRSNSL